jgi:hypothetical protein
MVPNKENFSGKKNLGADEGSGKGWLVVLFFTDMVLKLTRLKQPGLRAPQNTGYLYNTRLCRPDFRELIDKRFFSIFYFLGSPKRKGERKDSVLRLCHFFDTTAYCKLCIVYEGINSKHHVSTPIPPS